jgi:ABC-type Fe3+-hydroxamate transport system substrate-binding protein
VGPASDLFPLTITNAERPLTIAAPPERIVVLDGGAAAIPEALGARVVASNVAAGEAGVLDPDLVVAPSSASDTALSQAAAAGAPVYVTPDTSITEVERAISQLGQIVAEPTAARQLVRDIELQRRRVARQLRGTRRTRVFLDLGRRRSATDQTLIGDLIREARGRNVATSGAPMAVAQLLALDPEVYVSAGGATLADLKRGARTRKLRAVRNGRVEHVDPKLLVAGPDLGRGLEALARALHPDAVR